MSDDTKKKMSESAKMYRAINGPWNKGINWKKNTNE